MLWVVLWEVRGWKCPYLAGICANFLLVNPQFCNWLLGGSQGKQGITGWAQWAGG